MSAFGIRLFFPKRLLCPGRIRCSIPTVLRTIDFICPRRILSLLRDIDGHIFLHLDDCIRPVEKGTGTSRNDNGGNPEILIHAPDSADKRRDRLLSGRDHLCHQIIPHHEVGRRSVLVDQDQAASALQRLHQIGRLRGAATGILRGKMRGILLIRQVLNKRRNIHSRNAPSVLRTQFEGRRLRNDKLPSVSGDMVIDPVLQCLQDRGFPMISAAHK